MSIALSIEVSLELFEDVTPPCDHTQHGSDAEHHANGDEHYVQSTLPCSHEPPVIFVVCKRFIDTAERITCGECDVTYPFPEAYVVLGPVKEFAK